MRRWRLTKVSEGGASAVRSYRDHLFLAIALGLIAALFPVAPLSAAEDSVDCTLVLGFSQTADWYMAPVDRSFDDSLSQAAAVFESRLDGDNWQLMWFPGAGVNRWSDPNYVGWTFAPTLFPCATSSDAPERVVFMISGPFGSDVDAWADEIDEAISVIREKIPSADMIALQSVVGPPKGHDECLIDGNAVRASTQWKYIAEAIEQVAPEHEDVVVGALPRLHSCAHYTDTLGHIGGPGGTSVAASLAKFYDRFDW